MADPSPELDAAEVAEHLAAALDERGLEYALGGAIALGCWGEPRGTLDVDLTLFLPIEQPSHCVWLLQQIGCDVRAATRQLTCRSSVTRPVCTHSATKMLPSLSKQASCGWTNLPAGH